MDAAQDNQQQRRLSSEQLVRKAGEAPGLRRDVQQACLKDIASFCMRDADYAFLLRQTGADRDQIVQAFQQVRICLANNSDALSTPCYEVLASESVEPRAIKPDQARGMGRGNMRDSDDDGRHHGPHGGKRHGRDRWQDSEDDSSELARPPRQTGDQDGGPRGPMRFDHGGRAIDFHGRHSRHGGCSVGHFIAWLIILPFFCFGVYIAGRRALKHYRKHRRNNAPRPVNDSSEEYEPLKTNEAT